jgi:hypothetical protein
MQGRESELIPTTGPHPATKGEIKTKKKVVNRVGLNEVRTEAARRGL